MKKEQRLNNLMIVKALELTNQDLASTLVKDKKLDKSELSNLLHDGLMTKNSNLKLNPETLCNGFLNLIERIEDENTY